jgi:S-adenosylmethionine-diacylglycerol 3-amino-3-carboxypropyl transferase
VSGGPGTGAGGGAARDAIQARASFDFVRYGSVWEDADVLCAALAPAARGARVLSIASAGDNALALLTLDPAEVVAADLSAAQLACVELRIAALRALDDAALLAFLGVTPASDRAITYLRLRGALSVPVRDFWDAHPDAIAMGVSRAGKFERYLSAFRRRVLPLVHSEAAIQALAMLDDGEGQERFYAKRWDNRRWRLLFRVFFSRFVMGRAGRDPAFFAEVEGSVGERILARTRWAITRLPVRTNPYFRAILARGFVPEALPRWLRREHLAVIRARLDRVRLLHGPVESAQGRFGAFNLSDIFEYMPSAECTRVYGALLERAEPGARIAYWNLLAPRRRPEAYAARVRELADEAEALHARDRAWFYRAFRLEEVLP